MAAEPESNAGQMRQKLTSLDDVIPSIGELIGDAKHTVLHYVDLDGQAQKFDYGKVCVADNFPIPMPIDREGYGTIETSPNYWATGHGDWLNVCTAIERYCKQQPRRLFDFGCATGRFLRHVDLYSDCQAFGSDLAPANVNWVKRHLPASLNVIENSTNAKLPFENRFFDVVTAFSVFTHIDIDWEGWLAELIRITKPEGMLYITIQNQAAWDKVIDRPGALEHLMRANKIDGNLQVDEELFRGPMPEQRIVFRMSNDNVYNCNVWCTNQFVKEQWSKYADVLAIANNAHTGYQSVVMLRPKK